MKKLLPLSLCASLILASSMASAADVWNYQVTATKLDKSRNKLSPKTGGSSYSFDKENIENLPQGQMTDLDQVLLRAPGVARSNQGQLFVRGDHSNLQYRINGVMLPEAVTGFGQVLDTHFANKVDLLTGTLPAQYGFRTAGVVDITTKSGKREKSNRSELMTGQNNDFGINQQTSGTKGNLSYYLNATYVQNNRGLETPTAARKSIHNDTQQNKLFGYFSYLLDASKRLSFLIGNSENRYQIPNNPGQATEYTLDGYNSFNSADLSQRQREKNRYAVLSLQGVSDSDIDYQVSAFANSSSLGFQSDYVGDLMINGVAANLDKSSLTTGLQGDFSYELNDKNTLRSGFFASNDSARSLSTNYVFSVDGSGNQTSSTPQNINELENRNSQLYGAYLQNEWKALDDLTINYGARFDVSHAYVNESQLSPRLNALYDLGENTQIHAGYSRYFTPAPTSQLSANTLNSFSGTTNEAEGVGSGKLRAERTNYYDIGIAHRFNKNLNLGLDGYYKDVKNMLDEHQFGNASIYVPFNYEYGRVYGAEFTADYRKDNLSSFLNLAVQNSYGRNIISNQYIHEGEEIDYIAENEVPLDHLQSFTASAGASYLWKGTTYSTDAIYGSGLSTGNDNGNSMPSYLVFNAAISRDFTLPLADKVNFRLAATNLFDEKYRFSNGSGIGINASQFGMRRTFYLIASKSF